MHYSPHFQQLQHFWDPLTEFGTRNLQKRSLILSSLNLSQARTVLEREWNTASPWSPRWVPHSPNGENRVLAFPHPHSRIISHKPITSPTPWLRTVPTPHLLPPSLTWAPLRAPGTPQPRTGPKDPSPPSITHPPHPALSQPPICQYKAIHLGV